MTYLDDSQQKATHSFHCRPTNFRGRRRRLCYRLGTFMRGKAFHFQVCKYCTIFSESGHVWEALPASNTYKAHCGAGGSG